MEQPTHEQIAFRAYEIWQQRGGAHGGDEADWFQAEQELWTEEDNPLVAPARKVGAAVGAVVSFLS